MPKLLSTHFIPSILTMLILPISYLIFLTILAFEARVTPTLNKEFTYYVLLSININNILHLHIMSLTLNNPINAIAVEASRTHQTILTRTGSELTTGVKDSFDNIIDYVVGYSLKDNTLLLRGLKSSSAYVTNMISQANDSLECIHKKLIDIKQAIVKCKPVIGNSLLINRLNHNYRGRIQEVIRFIDNTKFDNKNLFDGSLNNFKVPVGQGVHVFEINIPQLLTSYGQLGINNDAPELQNNLVIIEDNIRRLNQDIFTLKNGLNNKENLEKQRELLGIQKEGLELKLDEEYNFDDTLDEQLEDLKLLYEQKLNDLKIKRNVTEKQIQDLNEKKKGVESNLRSTKENYDKSINNCELDKQNALNEFAKNTRLLEEEIEKTTLNKNQIEQELKNVGIEFEKNKDLIQMDLEIQEKSLSKRESDLFLLKDLIEKKDLAEKELKSLQLIVEEEKNNQKAKKEVIQLEERIAALKMGNFDGYKNKINGFKQQVPVLELTFKKSVEECVFAQNDVEEGITKLNELEKIGVDIVIDAPKDELTKELNKRKLNLETVKKNVEISKINLDKCQNAVKTGLNKIAQYEELMDKKDKITMYINFQNTDNKVDIALSKIGEKLVILNKKIGELEQKVITNKVKPEDLLSKKNELSNLQEKYNLNVESLNMNLEKIQKDIIYLEDKTPSKLENDTLLNDIESRIIILDNKFAKTNNALNSELRNIELALLESHDSKNQFKNNNKNLDESFNIKFEELELAIKKQDIAKQNQSKINNEIDRIENAMDNIEQDIDLLQINEEDKEVLIKLENQKQEEIENLKQIKENIATFIENNKEALRNQGGLFIREEFERSNILDIKALESCEEQINIALKRLSNIKLYASSIKQFFIFESEKISKEINLLNDLSNKYLATDYLQTSQKFVDSLRSLNAVVSVNIHGDIIAKGVLKLIEGLVH